MQARLSRRRLIAFLLASAAAALRGPYALAAASVTPAGQRLAARLDSFEVEKYWLAGAHVKWDTGEPDGLPMSKTGKHTHCSAFVAAAAKRLGVYILRPPEHRQILLANAQFDWLTSDSARHGWRAVTGPAEAQELANGGMLVVVAWRNRDDDKPGHIAIVRPAEKTAEAIASEGPQVAQAGLTNSSSISMRKGFAGHPAAWRKQEAVYFAHALD